MEQTGGPPITEIGPDPTMDSAAAASNTGHDAPHDGAPKALSKSAMKKAAKAERYAAAKLERRAKEKEMKKAKKRLKAEKRSAGELDDEEEKNRRKKRARLQFGGKIVIDLGFDQLMSEKEITSLCSQLAYTYSANRDASYPFSLLYTSLSGRTYSRLESMSDAAYKRWVNTEWWHEDYHQLWRAKGEVPPSMEADLSIQQEECGPRDIAIPEDETTRNQSRTDVQQNVIYLTADSEEELTELKPEVIYIIGGICDHNRYKHLCLKKANESGVRTARLPIGRYLVSLPTRKVLTVNQVFEILLKWVETRNWEEAFYHVIPKRKFQRGVQGTPDSANDGDTAEQVTVETSDVSIAAPVLEPKEDDK